MKTLICRFGLAKLLLALVVALAAAPSFAADLLQEIKDRGVFRVGMAESPPWQSPNPTSGQYEGFNVDLAQQVAKVLGVRLEIVPASWATIIPGLQASQYDAVFANLFATPERAVVVDFTEPYFTYGFHIVANAKSGPTSLDALNSSKVTFVGESGTVEESYPKELYPQANVRGVVTNDIAAWIGDEDLMPHLKVLMAEGSIDVEVHFGEPVAFARGSNRKETARVMEERVRAMMQAALADPLPSR